MRRKALFALAPGTSIHFEKIDEDEFKSQDG